jgi:lipopolysaccharide biosynthesis regulator YciM
MQISLLVQMLRERIEPKLIYSPFLRLIVFNVWFQLGFLAVMLTLISAALYLPKMWRVSPDRFEPIVRISGLDMTQDWALKRSARQLESAGDFIKAADAWQGAVAQNPADISAMRGFLGSCLKLKARNADFNGRVLGQMQWLLRINSTNSTDVDLIARVCDHFDWYDAAGYFLAHVPEERLSETADAVLVKTLFQQNRIPEFAQRLEKGGARLKDPELNLYRLAYRAGWSEGDSTQGLAELQQAALSGDNQDRAGRLFLRAAAQKNKPDLYARELERLTTRNAASAADHAAYWSLLASNGRTNEAVKLARSSSVSPDSAFELVRAAQTYAALGLIDNAADLMKRLAPQFGHAPEIWAAYGSILEVRQDWDEMRRIGRLIRQDAGSRESIWGLGYCLEGEADLAQKRTANAQAAFEHAAESDYEYEVVGVMVARELNQKNYPKLALKLLQKLEPKLEKNLEYWNEVFLASYAVQDSVALLKAAEHGYRIIPNDPLALNRYAASLLLNRVGPEEAIQLTLQLYNRFPQSAAAAINHSCALLSNERAPEAKKILEGLNLSSLSSVELTPYYVALFETYHALGLWDRAWKAREQIADGTLFPVQREWLRKKEKEMPRRMAEKL